jgi:hypothetical protein
MLKRKYQGREQSKSRDEAIYKETWYGTETEVDTYIGTLSIGTYVQGKGYLHQWEKKQENPAVWQVEVTYRVTYSNSDDDNEEYDDSSSSSSPKTYTLSVRNIQIPLESHPNYKACWNHYLIGLGNVSLPVWWSTATTTLLPVAYRQWYMWISSISEIPLEPDERGMYWVILAQPTKPGVQVYDRACFVVTEKSKYKTSARAGQAISHNINEIGDPPHKFGITGGEWKLDEGSVEHDGKRWVATRSWTRASDWDNDLYGSN